MKHADFGLRRPQVDHFSKVAVYGLPEKRNPLDPKGRRDSQDTNARGKTRLQERTLAFSRFVWSIRCLPNLAFAFDRPLALFKGPVGGASTPSAASTLRNVEDEQRVA